MIYFGAALMVYNIHGFVQYARFIRSLKGWDKQDRTLNVPIVLLIFFLAGYLIVGTFGDPDIVMAGILFGGSVFVFIIYKFITNITERILERDELESKLRVAEESNHAKTSFLATVSHEMRTPMNVILGMDELALKDPDLKPETRDSLDKIGENGRHLLSFINDILAMNDMDSGSLKLVNKEFPLTEAIDQVNVIVRTLCEKKGLTYEVNMDEEAAGKYMGDDMQVKQVLLKVLDNAVKFTDAPGTVTLDINARAGAGKTKDLTFRIADTGVGIDPEFLPTIFDAFAQEDDSFTNKYGGSGLGLAVTKRTLEMMGGTISVESEKGKGSVFTIGLSLEYVAPEEADEREAVELAGRTILVVEDIQENAEIVMDLLELEDIESEHAENGQIALDMFEHAPAGYYDAILMDLRMPVMDGLEASRRIRALEREDAKTIPIIALTANAFDSDVKATIDAGMNAHLAKPADSDLLYETIRQQIAKSRRQAVKQA